jgi:hypothetical protein
LETDTVTLIFYELGSCSCLLQVSESLEGIDEEEEPDVVRSQINPRCRLLAGCQADLYSMSRVAIVGLSAVIKFSV